MVIQFPPLKGGKQWSIFLITDCCRMFISELYKITMFISAEFCCILGAFSHHWNFVQNIASAMVFTKATLLHHAVPQWSSPSLRRYPNCVVWTSAVVCCRPLESNFAFSGRPTATQNLANTNAITLSSTRRALCNINVTFPPGSLWASSFVETCPSTPRSLTASIVTAFDNLCWCTGENAKEGYESESHGGSLSSDNSSKPELRIYWWRKSHQWFMCMLLLSVSQ